MSGKDGKCPPPNFESSYGPGMVRSLVLHMNNSFYIRPNQFNFREHRSDWPCFLPKAEKNKKRPKNFYVHVKIVN